jgi:uncharacterized protein (TIGR03067 family)
VLDEELSQLPAKYRAPLVLCYLEGMTKEEAARSLGWPVGSMSKRLAYGRDLLRERLTRRGVTLSSGLLFGALAENAASAVVPAALVTATVHAASLSSAAKAAAAGIISTQAVALAEGALHAMFITKLKIMATLLVTLTILGTGAGFVTHHALAGKQAALAEVEDRAEAARAGAGSQPKEDKDAIQGVWSIVAWEWNGEPAFEMEQLKRYKLVFTRDHFYRRTDSTDTFSLALKATYKLEPTKKPKAIDVTYLEGRPDQGKTYPGIYALEGDDLRLCYAGGKERPTEFATKPGSGLWLYVLKRDSIAKGAGKLKEYTPADDRRDFRIREEVAHKARGAISMMQLGLALRNYDNDYVYFPPAAVYSKDGKPLLSWRVALLPYLDQNELFIQFKLDEPWDSRHNIRLLAKMPRIYAPTGTRPNEPHLTFYQAFVGKGAAFEGERGIQVRDFVDGISQTILLVEAGEPVPWTKPEDLAYAADQPLPKLGGLYTDGFHILLADGSVRFVKKKFNEKILRLAITRNDGQSINLDELDR